MLGSRHREFWYAHVTPRRLRVTLLIVLVLAYVIGSIPTSYIVAHRLTGRDIREMGDGNPGMMNVWDSVGFWPAFVVGWGDAGKGMAAVGLAYLLGLDTAGAVVAGLVAVVGHDYPLRRIRLRTI
jgi:glycerol-3-phosphate acyltransferase PlsY